MRCLNFNNSFIKERSCCSADAGTLLSVPGLGACVCLFLFMFVLAGLCFRVSAQEYGSFTPHIKIGGVWDLSGPGNMSGMASLSGARKAVHDINMQGGVRGRSLELVASDSAGRLGTLLTSASALADREGCSVIIGPTHAALCRSLRGFAEEKRIPLFLTAGDEPILPLRGHPVDWTFSVSPPITAQVKSLFPRLKRRRAVPVGIISADDSMGQRAVLWIKGYAQEFQVMAGELQGYGNSDTDIISQIKRVRSAGAVTVFVWGRRGVAPMIAASMQKLPGRYAVPCLLLDDALFQAIRAGATLVTAASPIIMRDSISEDDPCYGSVKRFIAAMAGDVEYMSVREVIAAASAWDAVHMAAAAMRRSGVSRRAVQGAMENAEIEYAGVMGLFRPVKRDHCGLVPGSLTPAVLSGYGWQPF